MGIIKPVYKVGTQEFESKEEAEKYADSLRLVAVDYHPDLNEGTGRYYDHMGLVVSKKYCNQFIVLLKACLYQRLPVDGVQGWFTTVTEPFVITVVPLADAINKDTVFLNFGGIDTVKEAKKYIEDQVGMMMH